MQEFVFPVDNTNSDQYLEQTDFSRYSAGLELHTAVRCNANDVASLLLILRTNIDAVDHKGRTALWLSMKKGIYGMALFLIDRSANVNTTDNDGISLVHKCAEHEHGQHQGGKVLQILLSRGANPNTLSKLPLSGLAVTPLMVAVESKNYVAAQILIDYGADIDGISDTQGPALHLATSCEYPAMVRFLLDRGANPNARGHFEGFGSLGGECTTLQIAIFKGNYGITKQLLKASADVTAPYSYSWTPLPYCSLGCPKAHNFVARGVRSQY